LATLLTPGAASACVPVAVLISTLQAASFFTAGQAAAAGVISAKVAALTDGVIKAMLLSKLKVATVVLLLVTLTALGVGYLCGPSAVAQQPAEKKGKEPPAEKKEADKNASKWEVQTTLKGHTDAVFSISFSPDGKVLATASRDGTVKLWETETGKALATLEGHDGDVYCVAFAPDGKTLVTAGDDKTVRVWDIAKKQEVQKVMHNDPLRGAAFTPDGKTVVAWGGVHDARGEESRGEIRFWDPATAKEQSPLPQLPKVQVEDVLFTPNGKVMIASSGNTFTIWDWDGKDQWKERQSVAQPEGWWISRMRLSSDGRTLAISTPTVKLYDVATGEQWDELDKSFEQWWDGVAFSPDGKTVAAHRMLQELDGDWVLQRKSLVRIWDVATGKVREEFEVKPVVFCVAFAPDGKTLAAGCRGGCKFKASDKPWEVFPTLTEEKDGPVKLLGRKEGPAQPPEGEGKPPAKAQPGHAQPHPIFLDGFDPPDLDGFDPPASATHQPARLPKEMAEKGSPKILAQADWPYGRLEKPFEKPLQFTITSADQAVARTPLAGSKMLYPAALKAATELVARLLGVPTIDWSKEMVIVVTAGPQKSSGYRVEVTRLEAEGNQLTVHWALHAPKEAPDDTITYPAAAVLVPKDAWQVRFERSDKKREKP
jgi:WD40 repeat protein